MLANYEEHGFKITAKVMPDTCTSCPFWCLNLENCEKGICSITGTEIIADGPQDTKRMDDCPLEKENKNMKEELQKLIEQYGADAVAKAAAEALNKHVPTINTPVVTDEQLLNTISQLDAAVTDILEAGRKNEETYQNKVELARRARQLETSIQITEAEAINTICGTGKDAYGIIPYPDGTHVRVAVTNDTQRDAFRRHFSAAERKELASVEADIRAIEVSQFKTREDLDAKKEALSCIRAKAQLQAAALTYLA